MRFHRGGTIAAGLALCLTGLAGCGGGDGDGGASASPPTATAPGMTPSGTPGSPSASRSAPSSRPLAGKVVVIDPGHNGGNAAHPAEINRQVDVGNGHKECDTTGTATNGGYNESTFTLDVSKRLRDLLRAQGATVKMTRQDDSGVGPCINERAAVGNRAHADAAISIHGDGAPASGHGFHIIEPAPVAGFNTAIVAPSAKLALALRAAYHGGTGIPYASYIGEQGIDKRSDLGGLNLSKVPKVFIECGNMRNAGDAAKMTDPNFRQRMAESLARGFENYLR
ncbi:Germination-specific N-acetylmuramoyl-L-alanine amidase precursor [Actinomadura rubteroloni]|uniref:Germination-specific N-acetylmuramoyl-L-alanine amidase n=1 Tax=Actinomadura rubteroloni TaxID=1926885 RepID=A0A2P4ULD0_9ACTN|nr:N-acetylmuramoyl-L-alanine amidase [Actinomadura rubteroloni]POM25855.1 Germination-specific N-acetylmuramoyl-L-alanine amidase precursor [Actinomadura rubteroloni]